MKGTKQRFRISRSAVSQYIKDKLRDPLARKYTVYLKWPQLLRSNYETGASHIAFFKKPINAKMKNPNIKDFVRK